MRNLPTSVYVGGKKLRIRIVSDLESWGEYHHDAAEIRISPKALSKASTLRETLRHEIMHAALAISGVSFMETFSEEAVVRCFDEIFFPAYEKLRERIDKDHENNG